MRPYARATIQINFKTDMQHVLGKNTKILQAGLVLNYFIARMALSFVRSQFNV